jgi:hypothetical protein
MRMVWFMREVRAGGLAAPRVDDARDCCMRPGRRRTESDQAPECFAFLYASAIHLRRDSVEWAATLTWYHLKNPPEVANWLTSALSNPYSRELHCDQEDAVSSLKRYTQLPYLLHMLWQKKITLLSPNAWVDRNDAYFLLKHLENRKLRSILVMCLTSSEATYHHWHVFAPGPSGVRVDFHEKIFREWASHIDGARLEPVHYLKNKELTAKFRPDRLPFLKRNAFRDEGEERLIVEIAKEKRAFLDIPFDYAMIKRVKLSPWLALPAVPSVKEAIRAAAHGVKFPIKPTTILENKEFMEAADTNPVASGRVLASKSASAAHGGNP